MSLKAILETLEGLPPDVAKEYEEKEVDGKKRFYLILEDDVRQHPRAKALQVAFERSKEKLTAANTKIAELEAKLVGLPEDFDAEAYAVAMDELAALKAKKKNKDDPPDPEMARQKALLEQRITALTTKTDTEKAALQKEIDELVKEIERLMADDGLTKALVEAGVEKKLMPGATALLRRSVKVVRDTDTKEWRAFFETDLGETSIKDYVGTWAQSDEGSFYIAKAKGGGGNGGDGNRDLGASNPWDSSNGKKPNLTKQQEMVKVNPEKARQLATAAGAPVTW